MAGTVVLGLDPGSRCTGYGLVLETSGQVSLIAAGTIRTDRETDLGARLGRIYTRVAELIAAHGPHEAAVESVFVSANAASALKLGQARGAALAACGAAGVPVFAYEPTVVKKSLVGAGRAEKAQIAFRIPDTSRRVEDARALVGRQIAVGPRNGRDCEKHLGIHLGAHGGNDSPSGRCRQAFRKEGLERLGDSRGAWTQKALSSRSMSFFRS